MLYGLSLMAAERGTGRVQRFPVAGYQPHQGAFPQRRQGITPPPPRKTALRAFCEVVPRQKMTETCNRAARRRFRGDRAGRLKTA